MKDKQTYLTKGSFALLLFVILGYVVKFYPEQLIPFDSSIQTAIRGDLPAILTTIFRGITRLIDLPIVIFLGNSIDCNLLSKKVEDRKSFSSWQS